MPSRDEDDLRGSEVSVVRTESHLTRFNSARALFEKLGEENKGFHRIEKSPSAAASFAGTRVIPPAVPSRSRSSSAGSVSPPRRQITPSTPAPAINGDRLANGASQPPAKPAKPSVLPKPEKPDRRFNKELIEKQRNWTSHFNKPRIPRHEYDVRTDSKHPSGYNERKSPEVPERTVIPSRVYSPPLSPCPANSAERPTTLPGSLTTKTSNSTKIHSPVKYVPDSPSSRPRTEVSSSVTIDVIAQQNDIFDPQFEMVTSEHSHLIDDNDNAYERTSTVSPQSDSDRAVCESPPQQLTSPAKSNDEIVSSTPLIKPNNRVSPQEISPQVVTSSSESPIRSPASPLVLSPSPTKRSPKSPLPPVPPQESNSNILCDRISPVADNAEVIQDKSKNGEDDDYEPIDYTNVWEDGRKESDGKGRSSTPESPVPPTETSDVVRSPLTSPLASPVRRSLSSPPPVQSSPSPG